MKKRHSKRHTTFCLFVSNVHSRRNRIHPTPADDRLFAASQSVAFLVHIPDDANLSLSPDRYHQQLQACCISVLSNWGILCRGRFSKTNQPTGSVAWTKSLQCGAIIPTGLAQRIVQIQTYVVRLTQFFQRKLKGSSWYFRRSRQLVIRPVVFLLNW